MKNFILLILTVILFINCAPGSERRTVDNIKIITIDSCEYIECCNYSTVYIHKGNCKYCEERRKQELKEFFEEFNSNSYE